MSCQCEQNTPFDGATPAYRRALWWVVVINAGMFLIELSGGWLSGSKALQADALDFLGDTFTYLISLLVIGKALSLRSKVALFKGLTLGLMGAWVLGSTLYRAFFLLTPEPILMGSIALLAFCANLASVMILLKYRDGDANVRSVWLCSRNDAIGNLFVLAAALGVWGTTSGWPDLLVALIMASLFLHSSFLIIRQALRER
ncbi:MAG: cation diffusion facilitator family transporter [Pseudomonadota bacterium]|jgi:Co/Zn/Cd efflux system component|nr:cation diffusion facilitator family transporter [Pseudomonadota bacterium]